MGRLHLGTILGTTIAIDFSFIFLIALFIFMDVQTMGMPAALLWAPVILISVLFHELAHAATIGAFGYGPSEIVLGGFGGATMNRRNARPWQDMLISAAGPISSFVLALIILFAFARVPYFHRDPFFFTFLPFLWKINIFWAIFNLLPVVPLDGNGIVRNLLRIFLREQLAFPISIWVSFLVGGAFVVYEILQKDWFLTIFMLWLLQLTWQQWEFYRHTNRTDL